MNDIPSGYYTATGYVGKLSDKRRMLFATYQDYIEYISEDDADEDLAR